MLATAGHAARLGTPSLRGLIQLSDTEEHDAAHVLATKVYDLLTPAESAELRADELIMDLPTRVWRRLSVGERPATQQHPSHEGQN